MKKTISLLALLLCTVCCFCITTEFDKDGLIVNGYGYKKYTDEQTVSFDYFSEIRIFSAIQLDNWSIVQQQLDSGIGIDWKVIVIEPQYNMKLVYTPLIFAIMNGKDKIAKKLIEREAKLEDSVVSIVNGEEQIFVLKDLIFQNVLISKTLPSDFMIFYLEKRLENNLFSEYTETHYVYSGIYSNSKIFIKMLEDHLCYIDEQIEQGTGELSKEEIIQNQIIGSSIPMIIYGCIFSEFIQNKAEKVSSQSMEAILNLMQTTFCNQHTKEISEQFKQKVMPEADEKLASDDGYQTMRKMFLVFCEQ